MSHFCHVQGLKTWNNAPQKVILHILHLSYQTSFWKALPGKKRKPIFIVCGLAKFHFFSFLDFTRTKVSRKKKHGVFGV